jgi:hypothetical protein
MFPKPEVFPDASRTEHFTPPLALSGCAGAGCAGEALAEAVVATVRLKAHAA